MPPKTNIISVLTLPSTYKKRKKRRSYLYLTSSKHSLIRHFFFVSIENYNCKLTDDHLCGECRVSDYFIIVMHQIQTNLYNFYYHEHETQIEL